MTFSDQAFALLQYPLPHHALSRLTGRLAASQTPFIRDPLIKAFIKRFGVDMSEAAIEDPGRYASFNDFFTRALKKGARPLEDGMISPADGCLSQAGTLHDGRLIQAKGHHFTAQELLGGDPLLGERFHHGSFSTVYLSPRDYHRVHMPLDGTLRETVYLPGRLFSVNQATARAIPGLFTRNERLVCVFDTDHGVMAVVLVGAMIVAGIETVWSGQVTPLAKVAQRTRFDRPITLSKGDELGRFKLGSTVVTCLERPLAELAITEGKPIRMGQRLGQPA